MDITLPHHLHYREKVAQWRSQALSTKLLNRTFQEAKILSGMLVLFIRSIIVMLKNERSV